MFSTNGLDAKGWYIKYIADKDYAVAIFKLFTGLFSKISLDFLVSNFNMNTNERLDSVRR